MPRRARINPPSPTRHGITSHGVPEREPSSPLVLIPRPCLRVPYQTSQEVLLVANKHVSALLIRGITAFLTAGRRYWLRRRKPSSERGVDLQSSLGLPDAYSDLFDRIERRHDAWVVASGHVLLHTLERARSSSRSAGGRLGDVDDTNDARYKQLLDNCLGPAW